MSKLHQNLLSDDSTTLLPDDSAIGELTDQRDGSELVEIVARHPDSLLCWALLAEESLAANTLAADVAAYAYARTGYHRGLDLLRRNGWRGSGEIPWEHAPNQGFLRALFALSLAAGRLAESEESERCLQFLLDSSATAHQILAEGRLA